MGFRHTVQTGTYPNCLTVKTDFHRPSRILLDRKFVEKTSCSMSSIVAGSVSLTETSSVFLPPTHNKTKILLSELNSANPKSDEGDQDFLESCILHERAMVFRRGSSSVGACSVLITAKVIAFEPMCSLIASISFFESKALAIGGGLERRPA